MGDGWLETQRLRRSQYRQPRRQKLRGVIVVHTAESVMDTVGPDTGAENVARFIVGRDTPGSYHDLVDYDSAMHLVDYDDEAWQDGTGSNPWAIGLSFACRTTDWAAMHPAKRRAFLAQGARKAADAARHIHARTGKVVAARRITRADSEHGVTGFVAHGDRDPGRRTDPGTSSPHLFPWDEFLALYRIAAADLLGGNQPPEDDMYTDADRKRDNETRVLVQALYDETIATVDKAGKTRMDRFAQILTELDRKA